MSRKLISLGVCCVAVSGGACLAQTFRMRGSGGYGLNSTYSKSFNTAALVTFSGRITGIATAPPMANTEASTQIIVRTPNGGSMLVELGPSWYVDNQRTRLHVGDRVTVTGSKVMLDNRGSVMAQQVVRGNGALVLRSFSGVPYWSPTNVVAMNTGAAAQPIVGAATVPQQIPVYGYGASQQAPIYTAPTVMNGTIQGFNVQGSDVFMNLDTGAGGVRTVYLGPTWFLERQDMNLQPGQLISLNALTPVNANGQNNVAFAQQIMANGTALSLRNLQGSPVWFPTSPQFPVWQTLPNGIARPRVGPATPTTTVAPHVGPSSPRP